MRPFCCIVILVGVLAGCVSIPEPSVGHTPFVYPRSDFVSQTNITVWAGFESSGITNHADFVRVMSEFFSASDIFTTEERTALENDPFITTPNLPFVTFDTFDPAQTVAKYYRAQFTEHGWQVIRGILLVEYCNGGGDWVRVYQKGDALVHIHVMGLWKRDRDEKRGMAEGEYLVRSIMFRFIDVEPSEVLGREYRKKRWDNLTR